MSTLTYDHYVLWCMWSAPHTLEADVVSDARGVALRLFVNDRLAASYRFPSLSPAVQCADGLRDVCQSLGWHLCGSTDLGGVEDDPLCDEIAGDG